MNKFEQIQSAINMANTIVAKLQQSDPEKALELAHELVSKIEDIVLD